jgi:hypothetical protein
MSPVIVHKKPWKTLALVWLMGSSNHQWVPWTSEDPEEYFLDAMVGPLCRHENQMIQKFSQENPNFNRTNFSVGWTYDNKCYYKPSLLSPIMEPNGPGYNIDLTNYTKVGQYGINMTFTPQLFNADTLYKNSFGIYMDNQAFEFFSVTNDLQQCYDKYFKKFQTWANYFNGNTNFNEDKPTKNFLNFLSYLTNDNMEFNERNNLYWITRGPDGNLMGVRGPYTIDNRPVYVGKYIDENGLIVDDNPYYFSQIPSLRMNFYKPKVINYGNFFYNKEPMRWKCTATLNDTNFLNSTKSNKFFLCKESIQNLNDIFINGNNINKKTWNILAYGAEKIEDKNYFYNYTNNHYKTFANGTINMMDFIIDLTSTITGIVFNWNNFSIRNKNPVANKFNHRVQLLSWTMDLTTQSPLESVGDIRLEEIIIRPIFQSVYANEKGDNYGIFSTYFPIFSALINVKYGHLSPQITNGMTFIEPNLLERQDNNLKTFFMGFNGTNYLWLQGGTSNSPDFHDWSTRIANGTQWDSYLTGGSVDNYDIIFGQTTKFFNLYGRKNIYNGSLLRDRDIFNSRSNKNINLTALRMEAQSEEPLPKPTYDVNEAIYSINFFNFQMPRINFLESNKFTYLNNNSFLNQTTVTPVLHLYNKKNSKPMFTIMELDKNFNLMGCNSVCFFLDFNGFPLQKSTKKPESMVVTNNFNGTTFLSFHWSVGDGFIWRNLNQQIPCQLLMIKSTDDVEKNLSLVCYEDEVNPLNSVKFIYNMDQKIIYYPYEIDNDYWVFNKINGDKIYIHRESKIGFSTIFHQRYPANYFSITQPWFLNVFDLNDNNITSSVEQFITFQEDHNIVLNTIFEIKKNFDEITMDNLWKIGAVVGNGNNGLVKICQENDKKQMLCVDGDLYSGIIYYSQNYNNNPVFLDQLSTKIIQLGQWILKTRNFSPENQWFQWERTAVPLFYYNEDVADLLINCRLLIDNWFSNIKVSYALGNYCYSDNKQWQTLELLLYPQWDRINKTWKPQVSRWFLCLGSKNQCRLTTATTINCDSVHCFDDGILLNNNYIDRLNDNTLINILNNKYQLNIAYLIALHPQYKYFLPTLINFSLEGLLTVPYQLSHVNNYIQRDVYFFYTVMGYQALGTIFLWSLLRCISVDREKFFRNTFFCHFLLLLGYWTWIINNLVLIGSQDFNLDPAIYLYEKESFHNFYILTGIHGGFFLFHLWFFFIISIDSWFNKIFSCACLVKQIKGDKGGQQYIIKKTHSIKNKKNNILLWGNGSFFLAYNLFLYFSKNFYPITEVNKKI